MEKRLEIRWKFDGTLGEFWEIRWKTSGNAGFLRETMENPMETRGFRQGIEVQLEDVWDFPPLGTVE